MGNYTALNNKFTLQAQAKKEAKLFTQRSGLPEKIWAEMDGSQIEVNSETLLACLIQAQNIIYLMPSFFLQ